MKSLSVSTVIPLVLLLGAAFVHAKPSPRQVSQILDRSSYVGGWPLALAASESSGCPPDAPVTAEGQYTTLACCPSGQTGRVDESSLTQYCCPDKNNCLDAIHDFPACANTTWIMYQYGEANTYFCCEPGQTATQGGGFGLCEPADVAVPTNMINKPTSQDTIAPAAATTTSPAVAATTTASAAVVISTDTTVSAITSTSTVGSAGTSSPTALSTETGPKVSSVAAGSNSTIVALSLGSSATATTLTSITGGNLASTPSATGTGSTSASPSAKTGGSGRVGGTSGVIGAIVIALCFGLGVEVLLG